MSESTTGAGVTERQEDWSIPSVVSDYVRDQKLSRRKEAFLISAFNRMCDTQVDSTIGLGEPPKSLQMELDAEYINCTWGHLLCHVLCGLGSDTEEDPFEAPTEFFDARLDNLKP